RRGLPAQQPPHRPEGARSAGPARVRPLDPRPHRKVNVPGDPCMNPSLRRQTASRRPRRHLLRLEPLEDGGCPSVLYDFSVIASAGDSLGGQTLTALGNAPAVNDKAAVAFAGTSSAGQGLYVGGYGTPVKISSAVSNSRTFGPELS